MWNLFALITALWSPQVPVDASARTVVSERVQESQAEKTREQEPAIKPADQKPADATAKPKEAQEPEKAEKPDQDPAKEDEGPKITAPEPVRVKAWAVTLGMADWWLSGNEHKFRQLGTPPRGLFMKELLFAPKPSERDTGYLVLKSLGESDHRYDGRLALLHGRTQAEIWSWRSEFYDPTPVVIPGSTRQVDEDSIKQMLGRDFSISARYRMIDQHAYFQPPLDQFHQRTRYWDTIAAGRLGKGQIRFGYTDWRYFDRTLRLFDTSVAGWRLGYMWTPTADIGVEAAYSSMAVKQTGQPTGHVDYASISGEMPVGKSTDFSALIRRDRLSLPAVRTAYAREQRLAQFGVAHSWRKWNARISLSGRDVERVRGDQTFVDVPKWVTVEGRVDGRINSNLRLTLRGYTQDVSHLPPMVTSDPRSLYWSSRDFAQMRLQHTNGDVGSYFVWTHRNWGNKTRAVDLNLNSFVVGSSWQATPRLSLFAEYTKENWNGKSEINTFPTFENFLPDSHVISGGVAWMIDSRAFLSANVTTFGTNNENPLQLRDGNTNGFFLSINTRYLFPSGNELGLTIAPWTYRDDVRSVMNYDAAVVLLTGKLRF
jgi:hypothetical protein